MFAFKMNCKINFLQKSSDAQEPCFLTLLGTRSEKEGQTKRRWLPAIHRNQLLLYSWLT
jgi:ribosomal protein L28